MNFITIDFETATYDRNSPCEIGLTFVENNQIVDVKSWLIKPPSYPTFCNFHMKLHKITPDNVKNSPEFKELWDEIKPLIDGQFLIAHNAGFDMSVLRKTLEYYNIPFPELQYSCSYVFSKKIWKNIPAYDLKTLCKINSIPLLHHRAGNDSEATAKLCLKAFEIMEVNSIEDFPIKLKTTIGKIFKDGYKASEIKRQHAISSKIEITGNSNKYNPDSIFYQKTVVFTGTLTSLTQDEAKQIIVDIGGNFGKSGITNSTNFLVVGQQDYKIVGDEGMSRKQKDAIKKIENGSDLEMLSEDEFLKNI